MHKIRLIILKLCTLTCKLVHPFDDIHEIMPLHINLGFFY